MNTNERIVTLNTFFKNNHHQKFVKLALDGGFTCPNRDGTLSHKGCLFCSERGSGDFAGDLKNPAASIREQLEQQKALLQSKWSNQVEYIAYFQNFTNTYKPINELEDLYDAAYSDPSVKGLAIATRADCITDDHIALFKKYLSKGVFWVEIGLQTIHPQTHLDLNTHFNLGAFERVYRSLEQAGIPVVLHLIAGLPYEDHSDFMKTIQWVAKLHPFGVKIQMLNILKGTALWEQFLKKPFNLLSKETYIMWVADALEWLPRDVIIHRMTGDGAKDLLIAPQWILNKRAVLNGIQKELKRRNTYQGIYSGKVENILSDK